MPTSPNPAILPLPVEITPTPGSFILEEHTCLLTDEANRGNAAYLASFLELPTGFHLPIQPLTVASQNGIRLQCNEEIQLPEEGYLLEVTPEAVCIQAPKPVGVFHGIQTLRQLLPVEIERKVQVINTTWSIPCLRIRDWPRFAWRGFMLDDSRHFHGKDTVLRMLDLMALQKLNVFHWHLTDDQGWRIQIDRYPRLTGVGAWRTGSARGFTGQPDGIPHGGFYSQSDIRQILAYAGEHHIQVVPEIDIPGHSLAALAAYPQYSCSGGPFQVSQKIGIFPDLYCPGKEETFTFLLNILDEVMDLFPSPFLHIGGDETPAKRWKVCPDCQDRIHSEGLGDETGLKIYFVNRIGAHLAKRGRTLIGWSEVLRPGLDQKALVQYWIGKPEKLVQALRLGQDVIMSTYMQTYLDHSYSLTPLSKAYAYEPIFPELEEGSARHVLGLEALLWSEFVPNRKRLDYQVFPRLCAFAETGWTPKAGKDFGGFRQRLGKFETRLDALGVAYARPRQAEPPFYKRLFGVFTIPQPQNKTAA
jgi:hexosaminidase